MAGIAIPENLRAPLAAVAKYHFWILAALVPVVLVPLLFVGGATLRNQIASQRKQIESKLGQSRAVTVVQSHPNENWRSAIDTDTEAVTRETLDEWRRFWHAQSGLRMWPAELGEAFLADVAALKPGGKLDRQSLIRYQNVAPRLAAALPRRMGAQEAMVDQPRDGTLVDINRPGTAALGPPLTWNPASQKRLYDSFVWTRVPATTQVLVAQEELWVYGLFCDLLAGFVRGATGSHDSPLTVVEDLVVGFPAGAAGDQAKQRRILLVKSAAAAPEGVPEMEMPPGIDGATEAPWNPRYSTSGLGGSRPDLPGAGGEAPATATEDAYRGWVYVDFAGKPLSPTELDAAPDVQMMHLMPFVLRVVVDQRHLDRLLTTLAAAPIPIDVRQVRVNPGVESGGLGGDLRAPPSGVVAPPDSGPSGTGKPNEVVVELRGSVALATPPALAAAAPEASP